MFKVIVIEISNYQTVLNLGLKSDSFSAVRFNGLQMSQCIMHLREMLASHRFWVSVLDLSDGFYGAFFRDVRYYGISRPGVSRCRTRRRREHKTQQIFSEDRCMVAGLYSL